MKIIWYPAITLDGFIATETGDSDWISEADDRMFEAEAKQAGCVVVGKTTFDQYKGSIYPIPNTTTYVVTNRANDLPQTQNIKYVGPDAEVICERIAKDGFASALLSGGGETNGLFAKAGKIDEAIISIYPVVLGSGIKMFGSYTPKLSLKLVSSQGIGEGVVQNRYNTNQV
jgi:dihydrofolate reductase